MYNTLMPSGVYNRDPNRVSWNKGKQLSEEHRLKISQANLGKKSHRWKGGRTIEQTGYAVIYRPDHPGKKVRKNYVYEHRYVMEKYLGRSLNKGEEIHHIDGDRQNNNIDNLILFESKSAHLKYHWTLPNYKGRWT